MTIDRDTEERADRRRAVALAKDEIAGLKAENTNLRRRLDSARITRDMVHARMVALLSASTDMLNQLALLTRDDESYLWRIGGRPLDNAYKELNRATANVRVDADALLAELEAARAVIAAAQDVLDAAAPVEDGLHSVPDSEIARLDRAVHEAMEARAE